ncbi:MAG: 2-succinyl-6-hydroxy-2,4-cyclohexadiene-1-carboxylate synthase [Myxococcales bacterium]|nr:2-succinyl-6-hydroxy-2,4-cyclohexadiene-1-carboxylate synthase [Myxococcales bacterium]
MSSADARWIASDGVRLHVVARGAGPDVVLLHGFTGSSESMAEVADGLADRFHTLSVDLIGHGKSDAPRDPALYRMERCVRQLAGVLDTLVARRAHLLGYSMGGRVALALCAARPERIASALLVGASAGIADAAARAARRREDGALAERIERDGVPAFVEAWMARPLFASQQRRLSETARAAARAQRLACGAHALAYALRGMGAGAQAPLHERLSALRLPVCLAVGEEDAKFRAIAAELAARLPDARVVMLPAAGHAAHLENPAAFQRIAHSFFEQVEADARSAPGRLDSHRQPREVNP